MTRSQKFANEASAQLERIRQGEYLSITKLPKGRGHHRITTEIAGEDLTYIGSDYHADAVTAYKAQVNGIGEMSEDERDTFFYILESMVENKVEELEYNEEEE